MLEINDKYVLDTDRYNYILMEKIKNQDKTSKNFGKESLSTIGYYSTLEDLKCAVIEKEIKININVLNNINKIIELKEELRKVPYCEKQK